MSRLHARTERNLRTTRRAWITVRKDGEIAELAVKSTVEVAKVVLEGDGRQFCTSDLELLCVLQLHTSSLSSLTVLQKGRYNSDFPS
jgi:hypothetical protein